MILFELTMPHCGSWNSKWSQANRGHYRIRYNNQVPKELIGRDFFYRWPDGWEACVTVVKMRAEAARALMKMSDGFCGYDWMIESIIKYGEIRKGG